MSLAMIHASSPDAWLGYLAASIGYTVTGQQTVEALTDDYRAFMNTELVTDTMRQTMPPPPKEAKR